MDTAKKRAYLLSAAVLLVTFIYAMLRYNVLKGVEWQILPLYTLNKALAWTGLSLLAFVFSIKPLNLKGFLKAHWLESRKHLGKIAFNLAGLHAIWTLLLLRTEFGMRFIWQDDAIRAEGIVSIILGSLALGLLAWYSKQAGSKNSRPFLFVRAPLILLTIAAIHTAIWGVSTWFTPSIWPGYLPPITLLSSITAVLALTITFKKRKAA